MVAFLLELCQDQMSVQENIVLFKIEQLSKHNKTLEWNFEAELLAFIGNLS